jgi:hypothetical protein
LVGYWAAAGAAATIAVAMMVDVNKNLGNMRMVDLPS